MSDLYIMRHGETPLNNPNDPLYPGEQLRGDTDFPLNDTGKEQAARAGRLLRNRGIQEIVSSQLQRTMETAGIVRDVLVTPTMSIDSGLDTWSLGLLSGLTVTPELNTVIQWYEEHPDERPPGGETYNYSIARIEKTILRYEDLAAKGSTILLVTHGRILYMLEHVRSGRTAPITQDGPPPASVLVITPGQPGYSVLKMAAVETIQEDALRA